MTSLTPRQIMVRKKPYDELLGIYQEYQPRRIYHYMRVTFGNHQ